MNNLKAAFQTKFTALVAGAHNDFFNDVSGQLYDTQADQDAKLPYAVLTIISDVPDYVFNGKAEDWLVQLSLFSDTSSATEIGNMYAHAKTLFDNATLTITGATQILLEREGSGALVKDDEGVWQMDIDYRVVTKVN